MKVSWILPVLAAAAVFSLTLPALAGEPKVWIGPPTGDNGRCLRELFEHPDQWKETRSRVGTLIYADHVLDSQFSDDDLRKWFALLNAWGLKLELEVGAIKPWGVTGEKTFQTLKPRWDRFHRLGGKIDALSMDEPLCCCRKRLHESDEYAIRETAAFIALVRQRDPQVLIGDIETYPSVVPLADHLLWIDGLQKRLSEKGVRGLDFYRLDVNWAIFTVQNRGSWLEVRELERACRKRNLPFGLYYWASETGALRRLGLADDSTWYVAVMQQGYDYAMIQGAPDQYVLKSWVKLPSHSVPETDPWTFTRSVLDFSKKFVQRSQ